MLVSRALSAGRRNLTAGWSRVIPQTASRCYAATIVPQARRSKGRFALALVATAGASSAVTYQLLSPSDDVFSAAGDHEEEVHRELLTEERDSHEFVKALRKDPSWKEVDPYDYLSGGRLHRNFTAGTLRGKGKFALRPVLFHNKDMTECIAVLHVGDRLCGHDKIVHGGVLATLMDEMIARSTIPSLPYQTGFTVNLNVNYRKPVESDQFIVMRSKLSKLDGRKAFGEAKIESIDGTKLYVEATGIFVSPRQALLALASKFRPS
ncbi:hypothetical protein HDU85_000314 [Gaertneriomyces sp. JEL0708]|nr:hypothetical protein HDU85_000314 [Gaertneriomyces sp. JEL0708]